MTGGTQEGSESNVGSKIQKTPDNVDADDGRDGALRSKDPVNLSQETLARLQGAAAARTPSADVAAGSAELVNTATIASGSSLAAGTLADGATASAPDASGAGLKLADLNGSSYSRPQPQPIVTFSAAEPAGTSSHPPSIPRSPMTAQQQVAAGDASQQASAAHAWYSAMLATGQNPEALSSILSLISAEAARAAQASSHLPVASSAAAMLAVQPSLAEAAGAAAATPLSTTLKHLLQAGAVKQEEPAELAPAQQRLMSQPQQVTTGDIHAHIHASMHPLGSVAPDMPTVAAGKSAPALLPHSSDGVASPWAHPGDGVGAQQAGIAKSGSEVLKRTFEARPETSPNKRPRFQGGIAELQQVLSQRAQEGSAAGMVPHDGLAAAAEADARSHRPRVPQDLQAKDLTDVVRRESGSRARSESTLLKHLLSSMPRDTGRPSASAPPPPPWPQQPLDRSASGLSRIPQLLPAPAHASAATAASPRPTAHQLLQHNLVAEITGQAPRRLLDQLDMPTLSLILSNAGPPATAARLAVSPPAASLPASSPAEPLGSQDLQRMPRARTPEPSRRTPEPSRRTPEPSRRTPEPSRRTPEPSRRTPEPSRRTPASRSAAADAPLSPQAADQLYMRLEHAVGAHGAAALLAGYGHKPPTAAAPPAQPQPSNPQAQILDMLQSLLPPGGPVLPGQMRRDGSDAHADALREAASGADPYSRAASLARRPSLNAMPPSPGRASRAAPERHAPPASFVTAAQPSRRKQSPMLSLAGDRSTGLRGSRSADPAGLAHFGAPGGAPQLLTSSDLAKPVAPQHALGAVDLRSGPAASLATSLPPHAMASSAPPGRDAQHAAAADPTAATIIEALTGSGSMSPQARQRTLAAIGQFIAEQGQQGAEREAATPSVVAADAVAKAPRAPPPVPDAGHLATATRGLSGTAEPAPTEQLAKAKQALALTDDELQAAELLMALSGAGTPSSAAPAATADPAQVEAQPALSRPALAPAAPEGLRPVSSAPSASGSVAPSAQAVKPAAAAPAAGQDGLGSSLAHVLLQQMLTSLGMATPPLPLQPQPVQQMAPVPLPADPAAAPLGSATLLPQPQPSPLQALVAAGGARAAAGDGDGGAHAPGSVADAVAADLRDAYKVDSWRVDKRRHGL
eukprot:jgi/Ulvmu1/4087/UM019_0066.1